VHPANWANRAKFGALLYRDQPQSKAQLGNESGERACDIDASQAAEWRRQTHRSGRNDAELVRVCGLPSACNWSIARSPCSLSPFHSGTNMSAVWPSGPDVIVADTPRSENGTQEQINGAKEQFFPATSMIGLRRAGKPALCDGHHIPAACLGALLEGAKGKGEFEE
jgi:hypothetical protein